MTSHRIALGMSRCNKLCTQQSVVKVIVEGGVEMEKCHALKRKRINDLCLKTNRGMTWFDMILSDMTWHGTKRARIFSIVPNTCYSLETTSVAFFGQGQTQISSGNTWRQRSMPGQKNSDKIYGQNSTRQTWLRRKLSGR